MLGSAPQAGTPKQPKPDGRRESLKTPPTPQFGPGWVEKQKQKFERGTQSRGPSAAGGAVAEEGRGAAAAAAAAAGGGGAAAEEEEESSALLDKSGAENLDRLTLLLWQLQSGEKASGASVLRPEGGGGAATGGGGGRGEGGEESRLLLDEAVAEAERLVQERSEAKAAAARLSARVRGLETEQRTAAARMQEAGAMWSQASGLAQRTVEELSAAAERIAWLEEELAATRDIAASSSSSAPSAADRSIGSDSGINGSFQMGHRRGAAAPSGAFTYGSVGSQMAALRHVHERLSASEAMEDPREASALLRAVTSELASLVQSVAVSSSAIPAHPVRRGRNASRSSEPPATPPPLRSSDYASGPPRRYRFSSASPDAEAARPRAAAAAAAAAHAKQQPTSTTTNTASNHLRSSTSTSTLGAAGPNSRRLVNERAPAPHRAKHQGVADPSNNHKSSSGWRF